MRYQRKKTLLYGTKITISISYCFYLLFLYLYLHFWKEFLVRSNYKDREAYRVCTMLGSKLQCNRHQNSETEINLNNRTVQSIVRAHENVVLY